MASRVELDWQLPMVNAPQLLVLRSVLRAGHDEFRNEWPLWVVPVPKPEAFARVQLHSSQGR